MIRDRNLFRQEYKHAGGWWDDLRFPSNLASVGANAPTWDPVNLGYVFSHNPPNNQQLQFIGQLPHSFMLGTAIDVHIHWALLADGAAGEDVKWDVLGRWYETGDVISGFTTFETTVDVSTSLLDVSLFNDLVTVPSTSIEEVSSILELKLERDTDDAIDDHPHDVILKELDIHYQIDQPGSYGEMAKWGA